MHSLTHGYLKFIHICRKLREMSYLPVCYIITQ
uniref:Uncharacterized protein n=1 Tax=Rhizophora mucronata TaxID=61149 RepID=A0A2P2J278_RHIMU